MFTRRGTRALPPGVDAFDSVPLDAAGALSALPAAVAFSFAFSAPPLTRTLSMLSTSSCTAGAFAAAAAPYDFAGAADFSDDDDDEATPATCDDDDDAGGGTAARGIMAAPPMVCRRSALERGGEMEPDVGDDELDESAPPPEDSGAPSE